MRGSEFGVSWGAASGWSTVPSDSDVLLSGGIQIFSHLAQLALARSDGTVALNASGAHCPSLSFDVDGVGGLSCVHAVAFTRGAPRADGAIDTEALAVINRCSYPLTVVVALDAGNATRTTYLAGDIGEWASISQIPSDYSHPWTNASLHPEVSSLQSDGQPLSLELPPLSLTAVSVDRASPPPPPASPPSPPTSPPLPTTPPPPPQRPCSPCTDVTTSSIAAGGRDCSWSWGLENKCNRDAI